MAVGWRVLYPVHVDSVVVWRCWVLRWRYASAPSKPYMMTPVSCSQPSERKWVGGSPLWSSAFEYLNFSMVAMHS